MHHLAFSKRYLTSGGPGPFGREPTLALFKMAALVEDPNAPACGTYLELGYLGNCVPVTQAQYKPEPFHLISLT